MAYTCVTSSDYLFLSVADPIEYVTGYIRQEGYCI